MNIPKQTIEITGWDGFDYLVSVGFGVEEIVEMIAHGTLIRLHDMVHKSTFNKLFRVNLKKGCFERETKMETAMEEGSTSDLSFYNGRYFKEESSFKNSAFLYIPLWGYVTICYSDGTPIKTFLSNAQRANEIAELYAKIKTNPEEKEIY